MNDEMQAIVSSMGVMLTRQDCQTGFERDPRRRLMQKYCKRWSLSPSGLHAPMLSLFRFRPFMFAYVGFKSEYLEDDVRWKVRQ